MDKRAPDSIRPSEADLLNDSILKPGLLEGRHSVSCSIAAAVSQLGLGIPRRSGPSNIGINLSVVSPLRDRLSP